MSSVVNNPCKIFYVFNFCCLTEQWNFYHWNFWKLWYVKPHLHYIYSYNIWHFNMVSLPKKSNLISQWKISIWIIYWIYQHCNYHLKLCKEIRCHFLDLILSSFQGATATKVHDACEVQQIFKCEVAKYIINQLCLLIWKFAGELNKICQISFHQKAIAMFNSEFIRSFLESGSNFHVIWGSKHW